MKTSQTQDVNGILLCTLLEPPRPIILRTKNCLPLMVMDSFEIEVNED